MNGRAISGQCLCGAVTVQATLGDAIRRACHCDMCRRHTSAMFMSLSVEDGSLSFDGPVTTYGSSDWAERGFCGTCGSTLFYGTSDNGVRHPAAGLFDDVSDVPLKLEFFADKAPGYALAGSQRKMTETETIALFAHDQGDAQ